MRKAVATALLALTVLAGTSPAMAAPCKDAKGRFVKCPQAKPAVAHKGPCRDAKGKFVKCS